ncbi:hypothetical protein SAMN05421767_10294 [Granulicatella balaenopterae]|uniref:Uncharacterized protein n=1 Tax=Granulicatella balaenopterae TaxID=137733 RepID=A0A1H9HGH0_9LACT|nr:hypothetical protein [Granulicatella balaenopterae]SEQ61374.1 hypothetical protein SAMN05421767_10294 [Granulicatella balaenopterae]
MKSKKKVTTKNIILLVLSMFILWNVVWFSWRKISYTKYSAGMNEYVENMSYVKQGEDGHLYNTKYPDYLSFVGNLAIATPDEKIGLIIWPQIFGNNKVGAQIIEDDANYCIVLDEQLLAADQKDAALIEKYQSDIANLAHKAEQFWNIKINK